MKTWLLTGILLPAIASADVVWKGDMETGNNSQWSKEESVNSNRLTAENTVVREGAFALRAEVDQGDKPIKASGNRNELVHVGDEHEGSEYWYRWSTMFDPSFPSANTWQLFTQWHHTGLTGSPPIEFYVNGEELRMRTGGDSGAILWRAPLVRGVWNDFVLHVKWSSDPNVGFIELYYNGQPVVPVTPRATLYPGQGVYLKQGLYRNDTIAAPGVVYHDGFTIATAPQDVLY